jgi:hypothetical protein
MAADVSINNLRIKEKSSLSIAVEILKNDNKNILRTIRHSFEWIENIFANLKDSLPIKNIIQFTKGGEDALSFNEFLQSSLKMCSSVTLMVNDNFTTAINAVSRSALDLIWNFFKVCKTLQNYKIVNFASRFYVNLMAIGGLSFAISSADKAIKTSKDLFDLENSKKVIEKKDIQILNNLFKLAQNIGTCAIGVIVTANAMFGFIASSMSMLVIGTVVLISSISSSILQSYHLQIK